MTSYLWREYTLQYDRTIPVVPDEPELVPTPKNTRRDLTNPLAPQKHSLLRSRIALRSPLPDVFLYVRERRRLVTRFEPEASHERRIRRALLYTESVCGWVIRGTVVVGTPPEDHRIHRNHERGISIRFSASQNRLRQLRRVRPVSGPESVFVTARSIERWTCQ